MAQGGRFVMSRREFSLALAGLIGGSLLLEGCGGGDGGIDGKVPLRKVSGTVVLPAGLSATSLSISSSGGVSPLGATSFAVEVRKDVPSLVMVSDSATGRVVLMALVATDDDAPVLDATSTATALVYLGMGGAAFTGNDRASLLQAVRASPQVATLSAAIQSAQGVDPFALNTGGSGLKAATKSAVQAFHSGLPGSQKLSSQVMLSRAPTIAAQLLIEPSNEVAGLTAVQASPDIGFKIQNRRRRPGVAYTYMVGHTSDTDVDSDETPLKPVDQPLYIPSTKNILSLPNGWSEVSSTAVALSVAGDDKKTRYETIVLATTFGGTVPAFYSDPYYAPAVETWRSEAKRLRQAGILQGVAELVLEVLGLGGAAFEYSTLTALIPGIMSSVTSISAGLAAAAEGNLFYEFVLQDLLTEFTAEAAFALDLPIIEPLIAKVSAQRAAELFAANSGASTVMFVRAAMVAILVLGIIELADVFAVAHDTNGGEEALKWDLTAFQPKVQLTPPEGTYKPGESVSISASAPGIGSQGVTYKWSLSGSNLANLSDGTKVGASFTSTLNTVTLATTPSTQGDLVVKVVVSKNGDEIGTASAKFTAGSPDVNIFVEDNLLEGTHRIQEAFLVFPLNTSNPPKKYRLTVGSTSGAYGGPNVYEISQNAIVNAGPEMARLSSQEKIPAGQISGSRTGGWYFYKRGNNLYMYFDNFIYYPYGNGLVVLGNYPLPATVEEMPAEWQRRANTFTVLFEQVR